MKHGVVIAAGLWGACFWGASAFASVPDFAQVRESYGSSEGRLLDRHGEILYERRLSDGARRLPWVPLAQVPEGLKRAVLRSEDRRFREHDGVDWQAVASALWTKAFGQGRRGASTVTMQLASLLGEAPAAGRRGWLGKWSQVRAARELEAAWSKDEIFEAYLNLASFRGELVGIHAASRGLFSKDVHGLDADEASLLAALLRSPGAKPELVAHRACLLEAKQAADCAQLPKRLLRLARSSLSRVLPIRSREALAPHVAWRLMESSEGGAVLHSTLDAHLQAAAHNLLRSQLQGLKGQNAADGAVLVVDNRSGDVLAYVGSNGSLSSRPYVDGVMAFRQAGSTLKPFLFAEAFERRLLTPATRLDDSPVDLNIGNGVYRPRNYDHIFRGPVAARSALASSLNVPAVLTLKLTGVEEFLGTLGRLGFANLRDAEHYGYSLALGSVTVRLWDLVNAYRSLARGGLWSPLRLSAGDPAGPTKRVFSNATAFQIGEILSDRENRSATFGWENALSTRFWSVAKTGTSKDMKDNWCVGYTQDVTIGVWVGNFDGTPMWNVSGTSGAAPVWRELMALLDAERPSRAPRPPRGLLARAVEGRVSNFVPGTEPTALPIEAREFVGDVSISYPPDGLAVAFDPETPIEARALLLEASREERRLDWWVVEAGHRGRKLGSAGKKRSYSPPEGLHRVQLRTRKGRVVDESELRVLPAPDTLVSDLAEDADIL